MEYVAIWSFCVTSVCKYPDISISNYIEIIMFTQTYIYICEDEVMQKCLVFDCKGITEQSVNNILVKHG